MHFNIQMLIHHYGYFGVFFMLLLEMLGIPFPAETTLTLSGIEWTHGIFKLIPLVIVASFGNITGSSIAYGIGRFFGRPFILRFGKYIGITKKRLDRTNQLFFKYQIPMILFGKFIAGIRVLIPYISGMNNISFVKFSLLNMFSAIIWAGSFIILGRYIGIEWSRYYQILHKYMFAAIALGIVLIVIYIGMKIRYRKNNRN